MTYIQGVKYEPKCVECDKLLTKKEVKNWEINQSTYACSLEHFENNL